MLNPVSIQSPENKEKNSKIWTLIKQSGLNGIQFPESMEIGYKITFLLLGNLVKYTWQITCASRIIASPLLWIVRPVTGLNKEPLHAWYQEEFSFSSIVTLFNPAQFNQICGLVTMIVVSCCTGSRIYLKHDLTIVTGLFISLRRMVWISFQMDHGRFLACEV